MMNGLVARTWDDFRSHWRQALAFHALIQLLGVAIFTPMISWVGHRLVQASGEPVISNYDIASFLLSPLGSVGLLVLVALTVSLLLAEFTGLSYIAGYAVARRNVSVASTILFVLRRLPNLALLSARVFIRLVVLALPFLALAGLVWLTMLRGHDVNYYLAEEPAEWRRAKLIVLALAAAYALLAAWQLARWLYAVPIMVIESARPIAALSASARLTAGRVPRMVVPLLAWWLAITAAMIAITWVCRQVTDGALDWAGLDVHRVLPLVALFLAVTILGSFLYGGLHLSGHQFLVTRMYSEQVEPERRHAPAIDDTDEPRARLVARPAVFATLAFVALALGSAAFLASRLDLKGDAVITAHRGAKSVAPENTLAAFKAAIDAGADYIELDVQRTRDGQVVVMHDADFMRMGGDPRRVADLTAAEIATIDIGRKYDPKFAGEHAPELEQVIDLARGRIRINIELKYNMPDPGLAPAVIELLRREDFIDQVVVTSLDYAALKQVKSLEPRIKTGHIVTAAMGDVLRTEADFLSLNSAKTTARLVRRARAAGKDVAVWTVNDPEVMLRMIERGVDNIITDDPALLVRVMGERKSLNRAETLGLRLRVLFDKPPRAVTEPDEVEPL
jgi:glycerophosphoryl diester phosphodiesterase